MAPRNPFRARNLSPGRLPFIFPSGEDVDQTLQRFRDDRFFGQILGPHGSGKSTLLVTLTNELKNTGHCVETFWLEPQARSDEKQRLSDRTKQIASHGPASAALPMILAIDGFEVLSWLQRRRFLWSIRRSECGVLVTAHRNLGLPTLWETKPTLASTHEVIRSIVALDADLPPNNSGSDGKPDPIWQAMPRELVADLFHHHDGNVREVLFSLYDWFQNKT